MAFFKILCPVDFSEHSQRAVRFAALFARSFGSQITVLHVNDPVLVALGIYDGRCCDQDGVVHVQKGNLGSEGPGKQSGESHGPL